MKIRTQSITSAAQVHNRGNQTTAQIQNAHSVGYDAYLDASGLGARHLDLVRWFSVAIAMHHASRPRLPGKQHRLQRAINHVRAVISG